MTDIYPTMTLNNNSALSMTIREAFAMAAMQGFLSNPHNGSEEAHEIAKWSVLQANVLIEALKETP